MNLTDEKEAGVALEDFEALFIMRERTPISKALLESLPNLKFIMTSGMRNKAIDLVSAKKKILLFVVQKLILTCSGSHLGFNIRALSKYETGN